MSGSQIAWLKRWRDGGLKGLLISGATLLAWMNRFVQDDAFISFRYARNLADGHGLVWNIGERVEGYTNFLWTICLAPAYGLGVEIVTYAYVLSLAAFVGTLCLAYSLATELWQDRRAGYVALALLGTNYSFSSYATGGLETQFVTAWVMGAIWLMVRWQATGHAKILVGAALASACGVMTRMDASVLLAPFWCQVVWRVWKSGRPGRWGTLSCAGMIGVLPVLVWLFWRHGYYGAWVPNTFLIKSSGVSWIRGLYYVGLFYLVYGLWIAIPLFWWQLGLLRKYAGGGGGCVAWLMWQLYVISIGGDFMEFRMMMPAFPLAIAVLAGLVMAGREKWKRIVFCCVIFLFSVLHVAEVCPYPGLQTIAELRRCRGEWQDVASVLNRGLGVGGSQVKIAVTAAGIIPYYTQCWTLDLLGLNDRDVAMNGESVSRGRLGARPGHAKIASYRLVVEREVALLLNYPWVVKDVQSLNMTPKMIAEQWCFGVAADQVHPTRVRCAEEPLPRVVAWPFEDGRYLVTLYVTSDPHVDEAIQCGRAMVVGE